MYRSASEKSTYLEIPRPRQIVRSCISKEPRTSLSASSLIGKKEDGHESMARSRVFSSGIARLERHRQHAGQAFALRPAICTLHERPVHPGARQSEGGALYLRCVERQGYDGVCCVVRCRQAEHRRQWLAHRLFLFRAHAILSGQTLDEMPG